MVFSSIVFLSVFLPVVLILYYIMPSLKARNILLVIASLLFYAYGEPIYVFLMIFSTIINYLFGVLLDTQNSKKRKLILIIAVVSNLGMLGVFKYSDMVIGVINDISGLSLPLTNITLPIGISFFTFQAMSYVIDVYRGETKPQKKYLNIVLYISLFPQLIAGPIVKYHDIQEQIEYRKINISRISNGARRFIIGLSKKVLLSNAMALMVDSVFNVDWSQISWWGAWLVAIAYMLQIYFDFSGYSDMAIGLGRMFGFEFLENFNYPYIATSIQDFWRRWHISLSTWFKLYLYIPLGGNRKGKVKTCSNKLIVFFATGLWHGASWTFVLWGLWHGLFLLLEEWLPLKKLPRPLGYLYTMLVVCLGFVIFRATTLEQGLAVIQTMFTGGTGVLDYQIINFLTPLFVVTFIVAVIGSVPLWHGLRDKIKTNVKINNIFSVSSYVVAYGLLILNIISLAGGMYNPFIYFRF